MEVETFEVLESAEMQSPEFAEEAVRLIEELGLDGQAKLLSKRDDGGTVTLNPYRRITVEEEFVYRTLCPSTSTPETYESGAMPLRIMQVYAHAKSLGIYESFQVWHPTDFTVKDPVLVGITKDPVQTWRTETYLLARWGETLDSFATLRQQAARKYRATILSKLNDAKAKVTQALATINESDDEAILAVGPNHRDANFYW